MSNLLDANPNELSREDFESFFSDFLDQRPIKEQSLVSGRILSIDRHRGWVTVDVGYKAEGSIPLHEFIDPDGNVTVSEGDTVDVFLGSMNEEEGQLSLSKEKADLMRAWEEISIAVENEQTVHGVIVARVKGGLSVDIGVKAFLPGSQVDLRPVKNLDKLLGETHEFKIIKFNKRRGNIVLSRRVLLEQEREARRSETLDKLVVGSIMSGVIKNITDYGAFVDLGGIDGLLHITDMSYGRINHPSEMFEVGQTIDVKVLKFDAETQRVSLGYKQISPDPWEAANFKYPVGAIVRGKVVSIPEYGAFIELEDGIEGLVHVSEMTWNKRIKNPSKLVEVGDMVEAKVLHVDMDQKRISLGMKQLSDNPWDEIERLYPVGSIVQGHVRNITEFGIFVEIMEGIDGLVHISDLSWGQRITHPGERYNKGDEVEARVLNIDREQERFSLGIKQLNDNPWLSVDVRYYPGQVISGSVLRLAEFGIFVEIEEGVEGLVHVSELVQETDWESHYKVGDALATRILRIDTYERKISLSERRVEGEEPEELPAVTEAPKAKPQSAKLGDIFGDIGDLLDS